MERVKERFVLKEILLYLLFVSSSQTGVIEITFCNNPVYLARLVNVINLTGIWVELQSKVERGPCYHGLTKP